MPAIAITRFATSAPTRPFRAAPHRDRARALAGVDPRAHAPVPLLHALRRAPGWRVRLALAGALLVGFSVAALKMPSSDWAGIDPIHTQMAGVRAIEGGFSILRSTRLGLSAGIDAHGHLRRFIAALEPGYGVMLATLPVERVPTLYAAVGDILVAPLARSSWRGSSHCAGRAFEERPTWR